MFEAVLGNEPIKAYLEKAISEERLPQTLLFAGPDGVGKGVLARAVAEQILGSAHSPDLHILRPEGKSGLHSIDSLREMIDSDHQAPFESPGKVFILEEVERMQPPSANALLKTLEEPHPDSTFILVSSNPQEIIPTILSRCTILTFQLLPEELISSLLEAKKYPAHLAKLAHGSAGRAFQLAEHPEYERHQQILFDVLSQKPFYPERAAQLAKLEELLEEHNEEDPVGFGRRVDSLLAALVMWHRDQHVRKLGGSKELLFFPNEPEREPVDLKKVDKAVEMARLAMQRNMKISVCFNEVFLTTQASF